MTLALVTGSTGTVGANLVAALLERGIDVVGMRRHTSPKDAVDGMDIRFVTGDILDVDSLHKAMEGVDWVFHVAAVSDYWRTPAEWIYEVNVEGTRNVLDAALKAGVSRFVQTGSSAALGLPREGKPLMDEHDRLNVDPSLFPYAHSKQMAEEVVQEYVQKGLHAMTVLPSAVMGPRDLKFNSGELIVRALKGGIIPSPTGGLNFVDAMDCAEGHIVAAEKGTPGERYLLAGHNMTHQETLEIINETLDTSAKNLTLPTWSIGTLAEIVQILQKMGVPMPIDKTRVLFSKEFIYYDNSKAISELGIQFRPFSESVQAAYDWYLANNYLEQRGIKAHA